MSNFLYRGTKRGILYGKQKHDPCGRPGKAEQRGCDLQSPRGILYQSDRGEPEDRRSADREGDQGALFCFDAEAIDRVHERCVQPVPHGDRGKPRKIIVQMRKQENRIFNIIKPEFSSGCFFLVFQETD